MNGGMHSAGEGGSNGGMDAGVHAGVDDGMDCMDGARDGISAGSIEISTLGTRLEPLEEDSGSSHTSEPH